LPEVEAIFREQQSRTGFNEAAHSWKRFDQPFLHSVPALNGNLIETPRGCLNF